MIAISGYIEMAKESINVSAADFGIPDLREGINDKDAENVVESLRTINTNITKYKDILTAQGVLEQLANLFASATSSIAADK